MSSNKDPFVGPLYVPQTQSVITYNNPNLIDGLYATFTGKPKIVMSRGGYSYDVDDFGNVKAWLTCGTLYNYMILYMVNGLEEQYPIYIPQILDHDMNLMFSAYVCSSITASNPHISLSCEGCGLALTSLNINADDSDTLTRVYGSFSLYKQNDSPYIRISLGLYGVACSSLDNIMLEEMQDNQTTPSEFNVITYNIINDVLEMSEAENVGIMKPQSQFSASSGLIPMYCLGDVIKEHEGTVGIIDYGAQFSAALAPGNWPMTSMSMMNNDGKLTLVGSSAPATLSNSINTNNILYGNGTNTKLWNGTSLMISGPVYQTQLTSAGGIAISKTIGGTIIFSNNPAIGFYTTDINTGISSQYGGDFIRLYSQSLQHYCSIGKNETYISSSLHDHILYLSGSGMRLLSQSVQTFHLDEKGSITASKAQFTASNIEINLNPNVIVDHSIVFSIVSQSSDKAHFYNDGELDCGTIDCQGHIFAASYIESEAELIAATDIRLGGNITASGIGLFTQSSVAIRWGDTNPTGMFPTGTLFYNTDSPCLCIWAGSVWFEITP